MSQLEPSGATVLFHQLPISDAPFTWRGHSWIKVSQNHAVRQGGSPASDIEHIPSHDLIEIIEAPP